MKDLVVIAFFLFSLRPCFHSRIVGVWSNEQYPMSTWEFNSSGQLIERYGEGRETASLVPSTYQILNRSQSCSKGSTDAADQIYLKLSHPEYGTFCYYLETLSEEVLVLIDADTGKMLIFNRLN